jgi:uncharacterized zinc-type alcohol dehydrogenase-like protein
MPKNVAAYGADAPKGRLKPLPIVRRDPGPRDVELELLYCGICHSDLHKVNNDGGGTHYPIVPGHEIVGRVISRGSGAHRYSKGDLVGVGCIVDSCRRCPECRAGREMYCRAGCTFSFDSLDRNARTWTCGGYSASMVVDERYALRIPKNLDPARAAPLLCAGITTYSPLRQFRCGTGDRVGIVGLGGLGHVAVKLARSMGAEVTVLSSSPSKEEDAHRLGAKGFVSTNRPGALDALAGKFDLLLDTVSAAHDLQPELNVLKNFGTLVFVGLSPSPVPFDTGGLIFGSKRMAGSLIGGINETQEMLNYCGRKGLMADIELIRPDQINAAYDRIQRDDVRFRFVIDLSYLRNASG